MKRSRILGGLVFGAIAGVGLGLYAAEVHPSDTFKQYCAKCHGEDGKAQTPRGQQLKAQDFTDAEWQKGESDEDLIGIVTEGGMDMPAFGKKLSREQIESLVKNDVRGFVKGEGGK
ncbi:MAG TPA: c-type cytochrome [Thermoanaerobaculia bacterium]|jgi:mono/diheme cytochrome c family protein